MRLKLFDFCWLLVFPAVMSIGQLLFRQSARLATGLPVGSMLLVLLRAPIFWTAILLYGCSTLLWIWLLGRYPLSIAYPFATLAVVIVPVLEMVAFQQRLTLGYWAGLSLIVFGLLVIVRAQR